MNTISIRKVNADELATLREISIRTFIESFADVNSKENMDHYIAQSRSMDQIASEFANAESSFYFAISATKPVGYLKLNQGQAQLECKDENSLEIQQIYVDKAFQNLKIGQMLLDKTFEAAAELRCDFIWLGVWEHNPKAIRFYERNGFELFGKHQFSLGNDLQTDLLMKKMM